MRVTQSMLYRQTLQSMTEQQSNLVKYQNSLSSGVRLNQAADDPSAMTRVMRNDDRSMQLSRYEKNIGVLESRYGMMDSELNGLTDLMHRSRELLIQGGNDSMNDEALSSIANELRTLGEDVLRIANARDGQGNYLFAGNLDDTTPFSGAPGAVVYSGGSSSRQIPIDEFASLSDSVPGDQLFLNGPAGDMITMLADIANVVENRSSPTHQADLDASLERLDAALGHVTENRVSIGKNMQRVDSERQRIEASDIQLQMNSSALRDTDIAETVAQMSLELTSLEAARKTFSQIQGMSLFDFLR